MSGGGMSGGGMSGGGLTGGLGGGLGTSGGFGTFGAPQSTASGGFGTTTTCKLIRTALVLSYRVNFHLQSN